MEAIITKNIVIHQLRQFPVVLTLVFFSTVCCAEIAATESLPGSCNKSLAHFLSDYFGPSYREDENIRASELDGKKFVAEDVGHTARSNRHFVWVVDQTPSLNQTNMLFRVKADGVACMVLLAPLASSVDFRLDTSGRLPNFVITRDTAPPGFPTTEIQYKLNRKLEIYKASDCSKIKYGKRRKISCDKALDG